MQRAFRLVLRVALVLLAAVVVLAGVGLGYLFLVLPHAAPPSHVQVPRTPERVARGAYLARHVAGCTDCHGERDWTKYSAPQMPDREGHGGMTFALDIGTLRAPNITPAAIGGWSDGELLRAMTEGVNKSGQPLFPLMPYQAYRTMAREDVESIIAFIRTLPPKEGVIPRSTLNFPMNLIVRTIPQPATVPTTRPDPSDRLAYGRYLTTIADCIACHSQMDRGKPREGMEYAGGLEFKMRSGGVQRSANITPDPETGIGRWTEAQFVERFKSVADAPESELALNGRANTEMPWRDYGGMTREDLSAIYTYLRTVPPVHHVIAR
jgi:mono/diheme cytochrome c family protein